MVDERFTFENTKLEWKIKKCVHSIHQDQILAQSRSWVNIFHEDVMATLQHIKLFGNTAVSHLDIMHAISSLPNPMTIIGLVELNG